MARRNKTPREKTIGGLGQEMAWAMGAMGSIPATSRVKRAR